MRTATIKTAGPDAYKQTADFSADLWADTPHPSTIGSQIRTRVLLRTVGHLTSREVWGEALRTGWVVARAIEAAKKDVRETSRYKGQGPAFVYQWNRQGDFLSVRVDGLFLVVDLRSGRVVRGFNAPKFQFSDALTWADGKNWDRQILEGTWVISRKTISAAPSSLLSYRFGQVSQYCGD